MTPKEKAKELYGKYVTMWHASPKDVKMCATIAVDEILSHIQKRIDQLHDSSDKADLKYWQQVKQEIQNL